MKMTQSLKAKLFSLLAMGFLGGASEDVLIAAIRAFLAEYDEQAAK